MRVRARANGGDEDESEDEGGDIYIYESEGAVTCPRRPLERRCGLYAVL